MIKMKWFGVSLLAILLIACGTPPDIDTAAVENDTAGAINVVAEDSTEGDSDEAEAADSEDAAAEEATETEIVEVTAVPSEDETEEQAEEETAEETSDDPTSGPDHTAIFPAETPQDAIAERYFDHAKGSNNPVVTVIEYGDFQ